jgi:hypothetical protein
MQGVEPRDLPILAHSHLRWDGVWQRPQQILSRLARSRPVYVVEEPILFTEEGLQPYLGTRREEEAVTIIQPHLPPQPESLPEVSLRNRGIALELISWHLRALGLREVVRWHYAPMALYLKACCPGRAVVYDCMDELSAFKGAPPALRDYERELLAEADLVLTGGRSLYLSRRPHNPNTHRFDSGVDVEHFQQATRSDTKIPPDARELPRPVIGYYGVIDERMDFEAIAALAEVYSDGTVLLVGPVTKIDETVLPRARNIIYTGKRS